jgi:vanillate O-demethylase monooxygenase subunit
MTSQELTGNELDVAGEARLYGALRHFWHAVMYADELGDGPQPAQLLGEQLVVARLGDDLCVFPDLCVHRGTALSLGWIEGDQLRCAYHGWTYGPGGQCTSIPARFGDNIPTKARLKRYQAREAGGLIWVCLEDEPVYPIPEFPEFEHREYHTVQMPAYTWECSMPRRIENYVDFAHFAWVHDGVLGSRDNPIVPEHEVWREGYEMRMKIAMVEPPDNTKNRSLAGEAREMTAHKSYRMFIPNAIWLQHELNTSNHFILFMTATPIGPKTTRTFTFNARNYDFEGDDQKYIDYQEMIIADDRPITESQRPEELPVDLSAELHIRGVDRVSIEYRKWLIEIADRWGGDA